MLHSILHAHTVYAYVRTDSTMSRDLHLLSTLPQLIANIDGENNNVWC